MGTEDRGKDFNYFKTVTVTSGSFPATGTDPDVLMRFRGPRKIMFRCTSGTNIEYSFNGNTVHGRISANEIFNFGTRSEDKIWFRGTGEVDVHSWHIGV